MFQRDLKRARVQSADADALQRRLAGRGRGAVAHDLQHVGVDRRRLRVEDAAIGEDEVVRRHRLAIRPLGGPKVEGPDQAVRAGLPPLRHAGHDLARRILGGEAHHQIADDHRL